MRERLEHPTVVRQCHWIAALAIAMLVASGLESLVLSLLIAIHTTNIGTGDERRTQGVLAVLSAAIRPGGATPPPAAFP